VKVFWSWQSDTPGKTGRHFIRDALDAAVTKLKDAPDIEEPTQRDLREALHVDSDRQGVPGSPDLASLILDKIVNSAVFIADVTPVSVIPRQTESSSENKSEKRNMNPNVAIELGYAMHALSDQKILMVLNDWYGGREFLPFDLGHKAGPITFKLRPDATSAERRAVAVQLTGDLVVALRPYVQASPPTPQRLLLSPTPSSISDASYYTAGEVLAVFGEERDGDQETYSYPDGRGFYLRMRPKFALAHPLSRADMNDFARSRKLPLMWWRYIMTLAALNRHGAIVLERQSAASGYIDASTQLFANGELWGVNRRLLTVREDEKQLGQKAVQNVFEYSTQAFVNFIRGALGIPPPYLMQAGAVGLQGFSVVTDPNAENTYGPIHQDEFSFRREIGDTSPAATQGLLQDLFSEFFELTGYHMPGG
jgi:hypothetical protein